MNPFEMKPERKAELFVDWEKLWVRPYSKREVDPYTRTRVILMNGTEFENVWFSHQFSRATGDNELRRKLALIRRSEQQQQKLLAHLKPAEETALEHTIGYEQLAVDLTAHLAKRVTDADIRDALDFALLEDFDHLYRYADYLDATSGVHAEELVGRYTEIMPGRPTISHHRHPYDSVRWDMGGKKPVTIDVLAANVITAAEQQTMNYYMNTAALWPEETGRRLYQEIGMIEEQHVTQYGSLLNPTLTPLENLLVHQYVESWLYWSMCETETDPHIRGVWQMLFEQELMHLNIAQGLLREYEGKEWQYRIRSRRSGIDGEQHRRPGGLCGRAPRNTGNLRAVPATGQPAGGKRGQPFVHSGVYPQKRHGLPLRNRAEPGRGAEGSQGGQRFRRSADAL